MPTVDTPARGRPICVSCDPGTPPGTAPWPVLVSLPPVVPVPAGRRPITSTAGQLPTITTQVVVPPGRGALVRATTSSGGDGVLMLVTDGGLRYAIGSDEAAQRLGYDPAAAVRVPLPLASLLPAGPVLDENAAAKEFTGAAATRTAAPK